MSLLIRKFARFVAQKAASDPKAREKMIKVASSVVQEAKQIAGEKNRAFAAGKAVRRALDKAREGQ